MARSSRSLATVPPRAVTHDAGVQPCEAEQRDMSRARRRKLRDRRVAIRHAIRDSASLQHGIEFTDGRQSSDAARRISQGLPDTQLVSRIAGLEKQLSDVCFGIESLTYMVSTVAWQQMHSFAAMSSVSTPAWNECSTCTGNSLDLEAVLKHLDPNAPEFQPVASSLTEMGTSSVQHNACEVDHISLKGDFLSLPASACDCMHSVFSDGYTDSDQKVTANSQGDEVDKYNTYEELYFAKTGPLDKTSIASSPIVAADWNPWNFFELHETRQISATDKCNFVLISMRTPLYDDSGLLSLLLESNIATRHSRLTSSPLSGELPLKRQPDSNSLQAYISDEGKDLV